MGRIERLGRVLPGDGPVVPVARVRPRSRADRRDDEEADREDARRERARHPPAGPAPPPDPSPHVDIRA
ncbi:hypothetical protein NBH00_00450 [Paraconexibacter antarcticus]|uniref:Uncharacterized protein n=1 Tax=Paraconexibacter antarcticus TaxID=2949664 RepID=A0ABY5DUU6_9ACTN|nr:hypothetical protein [Paraconexibacter antarcticus]UTI64694.1 hypothetical protein NBH00_00450 [Paraconexibacter antarcticus]